VAGCALATAVGLVIAVSFQRQTALLVLGFTVAQMALRSLAGVFWAIPPQLLGGAAAAAGIAVINAIGNLGGFVGPTLIGALYDRTGSYSSGLLALTAVLVLEAALVLRLRVPRATAEEIGSPSARKKL
jgi:nitrate/nitrite transporter NarK